MEAVTDDWTPSFQLTSSAAVAEFLRELNQLIDFRDKLRHELLKVEVPGDLFHWPKSPSFAGRDWGRVSVQVRASGIEVSAAIEICEVSRVGQLAASNTAWDAELGESRYELNGGAMCVRDARTLVASLVANFYASSVSVTANE